MFRARFRVSRKAIAFIAIATVLVILPILTLSLYVFNSYLSLPFYPNSQRFQITELQVYRAHCIGHHMGLILSWVSEVSSLDPESKITSWYRQHGLGKYLMSGTSIGYMQTVDLVVLKIDTVHGLGVNKSFLEPGSTIFVANDIIICAI
jgi:hypothetical protein